MTPAVSAPPTHPWSRGGMRSPLATARPDAERQAGGAHCACAGDSLVWGKIRGKGKTETVAVPTASTFAARDFIRPPAAGTLQRACPKMFTMNFLTFLKERALVRVGKQRPLSVCCGPAWPKPARAGCRPSSCAQDAPAEPASAIVTGPQPPSEPPAGWPASRTCAPCGVAPAVCLHRGPPLASPCS